VESIYYVIGITVPNISTKGNNSEEKAKWKAFIMSSALQFLIFQQRATTLKKKVESIYYVIGITVPNISTKGNNSEEKAKWKAFIISASLSLRLNSSKTTL
jgi:hypothetical protein